jgi:hypothetical protein
MRTQIAAVIQKYGEPVELTLKADGIVRQLMASVQIPISGAIVNDFDLTGFLVYIRPQDVPTRPQKFDLIKVRGQNRSVEDVQEEVLSGEIMAYMLRVRG